MALVLTEVFRLYMLSVMASSDDATSVDTQVGVPGRSHMHRDAWFVGIVADQGT